MLDINGVLKSEFNCTKYLSTPIQVLRRSHLPVALSSLCIGLGALSCITGTGHLSLEDMLPGQVKVAFLKGSYCLGYPVRDSLSPWPLRDDLSSSATLT